MAAAGVWDVAFCPFDTIVRHTHHCVRNFWVLLVGKVQTKWEAVAVSVVLPSLWTGWDRYFRALAAFAD